MHIHTVRTLFRRSKQPKDYESAEPICEMTASVDPDEDADAVCRAMMIGCVQTVYAAIGYDVPQGARDKLMRGYVPEGGEVAKHSSEVEADSKPEAEEESKPETRAENGNSGKKRGRPPKNEKKDDNRNISDAPEDRKESDDIPDDPTPTENDSDIPDDPTEDQIEYTHTDVQKLVTEVIQKGKVKSAQVKELIASEGAGRISELSTEATQRIYNKLSSM